MPALTESAILDGLNPAQRDSVLHDSGPLIVLAGPGTGKTRVIVHRVAHLIAVRGVDPASVLALTFTNKAAQELRDRLAETVGFGPAERVTARTFNAFGMDLVRRFADRLGLRADPQLIDSAQRKRMLRGLVSEHGLFRDAAASGVEARIELARAHIHALHCAGLTPATAAKRFDHRVDLLDRIAEPTDEQRGERANLERWRESVRLWRAQQTTAVERSLISFDDQIALANRLLAEHELARDICRADYRHVIVDEFQDVNAAQIELLRQIAPPSALRPPDLCVVGDDDQSIYGFRGADDRALDRFDRIWSEPDRAAQAEVRTVRLTENWRSEQPVLDAANAVITAAHHRFAPDKKVIRPAHKPPHPDGPGSVEAVRLEHHLQAGDVISAIIAADRQADPGRSFGSYAVIARTHTDLGRIRSALELAGIPVRAARPRAAAEDPGVRDVLAWVDLILDPAATWAARRLLRRPPFSFDAQLVASWDGGYRGARSRAEAGDPDAPPLPGSGGFFHWVSANPPPALAEPVARARGWYDDFVACAASESADTVIQRIIKTTGVAQADLPDDRERARRIRALVSLLRFARDRLHRLEAPGDLRAFQGYFDDLDPSEQRLDPPEEAGDPGWDSDAPEDGVALLTAHAAKGLEYDTVFLPRVETQHGYPMLRAPEPDHVLPSSAAADQDEPRSPAEALQDEERRLFYVACTRAERRLVVLGKLPKKRPARLHFFYELTDAGVPERSADDVLTEAAESGAIVRTDDELGREVRVDASWTEAETRRERLLDARREARLDAAAALDAADRATADEATFDEAIAGLTSAAARLRAVAAAQASAPLPAWLSGQGLPALHASLADASAEPVRTDSGFPFRAVEPPITISYTLLRAYKNCPRCCYFTHVEKLAEPEGSAQIVGQVVHAALHRHLAAVKSATDEGQPPPGPEDLLRLAEGIFFSSWPARGPSSATSLSRSAPSSPRSRAISSRRPTSPRSSSGSSRCRTSGTAPGTACSCSSTVSIARRTGFV